MLDLLPLEFGLLAIGGALYYAQSQTQYARTIGKYLFLFCALIAVWQALLDSGQADWILGLFTGLVGITVLFLTLDVIMPVLRLLMKLVSK